MHSSEIHLTFRRTCLVGPVLAPARPNTQIGMFFRARSDATTVVEVRAVDILGRFANDSALVLEPPLLMTLMKKLTFLSLVSALTLSSASISLAQTPPADAPETVADAAEDGAEAAGDAAEDAADATEGAADAAEGAADAAEGAADAAEGAADDATNAAEDVAGEAAEATEAAQEQAESAGEAAAGLGEAAGEAMTEPEPQLAEPEPEVSETLERDLEAAAAESRGELPGDREAAAGAAGEGGEGGEGGESGEGAPSTADRLASANPTAGLPWSMPITWAQNLGIGQAGASDYVPYYQWRFTLAPRWNFTPALSIGLTTNISVELTNANQHLAIGSASTTNREIQIDDVRLDLTYTLPFRPGGVMLITAARLRAPTSQLSRNLNRYIRPELSVLALKPLPVGEGLLVGGQVLLSGWLAGEPRGRRGDSVYTDGEGNPVNPCPVAESANDIGAVSRSSNCGGGVARVFTPAAGVFMNFIPVNRLTLGASFFWFGLRGRAGADAYLPPDQVATAGGNGLTIGDNSDTKWVHFTSFGLSVSYDIFPYLTVGLNYSTLAVRPDSDGSVENWFYNENTTIGATLQFRPSAFVSSRRAAAAAAEAEAEE